MLVNMYSSNLTINTLLEEALNEPDIGTTSRFRWHATAIGIAALWTETNTPSTPPLRGCSEGRINSGLGPQPRRTRISPSGTGTCASFSFLIKSVQANGPSMAIVQSNQQSHRGHIPQPQPSGSQHSLHSTKSCSRVKEL